MRGRKKTSHSASTGVKREKVDRGEARWADTAPWRALRIRKSSWVLLHRMIRHHLKGFEERSHIN